MLGNHDYHCDQEDEVAEVLDAAGVVVLEGGAVVEVPAGRLGVAGTKGFGGGFAGASGSDFGEPEMKAFMQHTKALAARLEASLAALDAEARVALLHYAPTEGRSRANAWRSTRSSAATCWGRPSTGLAPTS